MFVRLLIFKVSDLTNMNCVTQEEEHDCMNDGVVFSANVFIGEKHDSHLVCLESLMTAE